MTEPTDQPAAAAAESPPPASSRAPRSALPAAALVVSLAALALAGGGAYLVWQRLEALDARQSALVSSAELEDRLVAVAQEREALRQRLEQMGAEHAQALARLEQQQADVIQSQNQMEARVARLDAQTQANQSAWLQAQATHLMRTAMLRVRFHQDVEGALAALRLADRMLEQAGASTVPARQAVRRAVEQLLTVSLPDTPELARRIETLIRRVDLLPLDMQLVEADVRAEAQAVPEPAAAEGWRGWFSRAWSRFKGAMSELVVVRRDEPLEPLIAPEERYFLYHNLRLRLEAARLALLNGNEDLYRSSISRATQWIQRYYALGEPEVEAALAELAELRKVDVSPDLPKLEPLLEPVLSR